MGDIIGDLNSKRAHIESIETRDEVSTIHALVPLAETFGYTTTLRSVTQGRATHAMEFHRYQEVPAGLIAQMTEQVGVKR